MTYATLMVHLEIGRSNGALLQIAGNLAQRFHAGVIGIAACQPLQIVYGDGFITGDLIEEDRNEMARELQKAEADFRSALEARAASIEWRSTVLLAALSDYLAREARGADLVITGVASGNVLDAPRAANTSDLVMQVGRPVLIVPGSTDNVELNRVVVGWKDTRETRRAVYDALPVLKMATHVAVVEICDEEDLAPARMRLNDVVAWLGRHGVVAQLFALPSSGTDTAQLYAIAEEQNADVIVAGAYGHSRLREWVLGGVTRDLLLNARRCSFVSH